MLHKRIKVLSQRDQRRRQERQLKKGGATSVSFKREGSDAFYNVSLSDSALTEIKLGVTTSLFGTSQASISGFNSKVHHNTSLINAVSKTIEGIFRFPSDEQYLSSVSFAVKEAQELRQAQQDCLSDPFAAKLLQAKLPLQKDLVEAFRKQYAKRFGLASPEHVNAQNLEKMAESYHSDMAKKKSAFRQNEVIFSQRLRVADSLEGMMESVERVAKEGSPMAAYLYFTRSVRIRIPENAENRIQLVLGDLFRLPIVYFQNSIFRFLRLAVQLEKIYIDVAKNGLDNLLLVLDQEERRVRHSNRLRHVMTHRSYFTDTPIDVYNFAIILGKVGAKAGSAAELLSEVPIGQRKSAFKLLKRDPRLVLMYEQLKEGGVDARSYSSFATDLANVEVVLNGEKRTLQNIMGELAVDERHRSGAAWLVRHPEVWGRSDVAQILSLASNNHASMKLELYNKWSEDPIKSNVVLEVAPTLSAPEVGVLSAALPKIDREDLRFIPELTLDGVLSLLKTEPQEAASAPQQTTVKESPERARNRVFWVNLAYQGNIELINAALKAYEVVPSHLQHKIKGVDDYVREHNKPAIRESMLMQYFTSITSMSVGLIRHVLSDDLLLEGFLQRSHEHGLVARLEEIAMSNGNTYSGLYDVLVREHKLKTPNEMFTLAIARKFAETDTPISGTPAAVNGSAVAEGVVYRIAIFGNFENDKKFTMEVTERLAGSGIEAVFVSHKKRGTAADCDGMLVVPGRNTPHSASVRSYYEGNVPVMSVSGYGVDSVVKAAVAFRDKLSNSYVNLSA